MFIRDYVGDDKQYCLLFKYQYFLGCAVQKKAATYSNANASLFFFSLYKYSNKDTYKLHFLFPCIFFSGKFTSEELLQVDRRLFLITDGEDLDLSFVKYHMSQAT